MVQFRFQLLDLLTQRRLRDMLAFRCMGEATFLGNSDKITELMNLHRGQSARSNVLSKTLRKPAPLLPNFDSLTKDMLVANTERFRCNRRAIFVSARLIDFLALDFSLG